MSTLKGNVRNHVQQLPVGWQLLGVYLVDLADRLANRTITSPGLVIKAVASALVKAGSAFDAIVSDGKVGRIITTPINTDMAALVGTVAADAFNIYAFFIDKAGTLTSAMGIAGATAAAVVFPPVPAGKACIGYIRVNPTGTGDFVGGTTALDDATVVPNVVYVNVTGPFDPQLVP
jgi:hypothetical protein